MAMTLIGSNSRNKIGPTNIETRKLVIAPFFPLDMSYPYKGKSYFVSLTLNNKKQNIIRVKSSVEFFLLSNDPAT